METFFLGKVMFKWMSKLMLKFFWLNVVQLARATSSLWTEKLEAVRYCMKLGNFRTASTCSCDMNCFPVAVVKLASLHACDSSLKRWELAEDHDEQHPEAKCWIGLSVPSRAVPVLQGSAVAPSGTSALATVCLQLSGGEGNSFSLSPILCFLL